MADTTEDGAGLDSNESWDAAMITVLHASAFVRSFDRFLIDYQ